MQRYVFVVIGALTAATLAGCGNTSGSQLLNAHAVSSEADVSSRQSMAARTLAQLVISRTTGKPLDKAF